MRAAQRWWGERGVSAVVLVILGVVVARAGWTRPEVSRQTAIRTGTETVLVFIASTTCAGIKRPELRQAVRAIRDRLEADAERAGGRLVMIGVSLDWDLGLGAGLLEAFGPFDEILVGRGWLNSGAMKYIWSDHPGRAGIPQIVVLERSVEKGRAIQVEGERVLYRFVGAERIEQGFGTSPTHAADGSASRSEAQP